MRLILCSMWLTTACLSSLPADGVLPAPVTSEEHAATLLGLAPPKHLRPTIAIVSALSGAETTDFLIPYGVLKRADVADVYAASSVVSDIALHPALATRTERSFDELDAQLPDGVDYVIVPAFHDPTDAAVVAWVKAQAAKGAIIVGICSGVRVLGYAGLLDGRSATGHWADLVDLTASYPSMKRVRDRRYVVDRGIATTTGVTASIPISLALIEAIAGTERASEVARGLGVKTWSEEHDSDAFQLTGELTWAVVGNQLALWNAQRVGIAVTEGVDEVSLALAADAFSRTYRSRAEATGSAAGVTSRSGLRISATPQPASPNDFELPSTDLPAQTLDVALAEIQRRYGPSTAAFVALQEEYVWSAQ